MWPLANGPRDVQGTSKKQRNGQENFLHRRRRHRCRHRRRCLH